MTRGTLALVVGPSGAGKDTLIRGARAALVHRSEFVFPVRQVTRPAQAAAGEDYLALSDARFLERRALGAYALSWRAHGLWYGVPRSVEHSLAQGRIVVVNASRAVIAEARNRYPRRRIFFVTAPEPVLMRRLEARGREAGAEIAARVDRARAYEVTGTDVVTVHNTAPAGRAIARFVGLLEDLLVPAL